SAMVTALVPSLHSSSLESPAFAATLDLIEIGDLVARIEPAPIVDVYLRSVAKGGYKRPHTAFRKVRLAHSSIWPTGCQRSSGTNFYIRSALMAGRGRLTIKIHLYWPMTLPAPFDAISASFVA